MRIEPTERLCQCAKPACGNRLTHRHHKGCETMLIRAFKRHAKQKRYKALVRRYKRFLKTDTCEICENHHEEIHHLYGQVILKEVKRLGFKPLRSWTWTEAEALMKQLRAYCDGWLQKKTPGRRLMKFRHTN